MKIFCDFRKSALDKYIKKMLFVGISYLNKQLFDYFLSSRIIWIFSQLLKLDMLVFCLISVDQMICINNFPTFRFLWLDVKTGQHNEHYTVNLLLPSETYIWGKFNTHNLFAKKYTRSGRIVWRTGKSAEQVGLHSIYHVTPDIRQGRHFVWWSLKRKQCCPGACVTWWRHQMETFSALLALCTGNSRATGEFPYQRPVTRSFNVFLDLRLNKRLNKQSWCQWFETPSCSLWRHRNVEAEAVLCGRLCYMACSRYGPFTVYIIYRWFLTVAVL